MSGLPFLSEAFISGWGIIKGMLIAMECWLQIDENSIDGFISVSKSCIVGDILFVFDVLNALVFVEEGTPLARNK